jgi:hypothetical protein
MAGTMMHDNTYDVLNGILDSDSRIRFAGLVDKNGRLIMHAYNEGVLPLLTDKEAEKSTLLTTIKMAMREPLEEKLGRVEYSVTVYEKVKRITIPVRKHDLLLLISTERLTDHEKLLAEKVFPMLAMLQ